MGTKYKMTGCARMALFLVVLLPIAYFGAKYLQNSGTWDKVQDKLEKKEDISVPERPQNQDTRDQDRLRDQNVQQEELIRKQQDRIRELEEKVRTGSNNSTTVPRETHNQPRERTTNQTSNDGPSIEELLRESDNNLGTGPSPDTSPKTSGARLLGKWSFSYGGMSGYIELLEQNNNLLSRITQPNESRDIIDELEIRGDRYYVKGSPTGEYYIFNNGDLDAYDQNGFQTTCRRAR